MYIYHWSIDHICCLGRIVDAQAYMPCSDFSVRKSRKPVVIMFTISSVVQAANAQAALAFELYQRKFSGPRWEALAKRGAQKQRVLWASTGVKDPSYPDTLYVNPLIGPDTVSHFS